MLKVKDEIQKTGKSQRRLAQEWDMNPSTLSAICCGRQKPYSGQMKKICDGLGWVGNPSALFEEMEG